MQTEDITWTLTVSDQGTGETIEVADAGDDDNPAHPRVVENRAPYGHGGVIPSGSNVAIVRADDGGVGFAAYVPRPSFADTVGDVWAATADGGGWRLTPTLTGTQFEVTGCDSLDGIILGSDGVTLYVARSADPVALGGVGVGTIQATSVMVKAG